MFNKKTWKGRISEYPNRRILTDGEGNQERYTVTRDEGIISQEGDGFTKANMDDLESRIDNAFVAEHTFVTGTLVAGTTILDLVSPLFTSDAIFHVMVPTDHSKLVYESIELINEYTLRLTFPAQDEDVEIKVKVEYDLTPTNV